ASRGEDAEGELVDGYIYSVQNNLGGDRVLLKRVCEETNYLGEIRAAVLIVQSIRFDPKELGDPKPTRPREVLQRLSAAVHQAIVDCDLSEPGKSAVQKALQGYAMFS